jgi:DNA-binding response OmpR family regulator
MADTNQIRILLYLVVLKKVLIVEDEKALADALEMKLKHEGFAVARAANGQEGLEAVLSFSPDVILLDLMMPVMDGKTMLRKLRDLPQFKTLPIIVLTNAGTVDNIRKPRLL